MVRHEESEADIMQVKEIMTRDVAYCSPDTSLQEIARMMREHDCGAIPVFDNDQNRHVIGIVTDRDIVIRAVAQGQNPAQLTARDVMSQPVATIPVDADIDECCRLMEERQVRRVPVVERDGSCVGIVSQADVARSAPEHETAEVVQEISKPGYATAGQR